MTQNNPATNINNENEPQSQKIKIGYLGDNYFLTNDHDAPAEVHKKTRANSRRAASNLYRVLKNLKEK